MADQLMSSAAYLGSSLTEVNLQPHSKPGLQDSLIVTEATEDQQKTPVRTPGLAISNRLRSSELQNSGIVITVTEPAPSPILEESEKGTEKSEVHKGAALTPTDAAAAANNLNISKRQIVPRRQGSATSDQLNLFEKLASLEDLGASVS